jgi:hypothetical protein
MKRTLLVLFLCLAVIAFFGCKKEEKKDEKTKETTEVKKPSDEDQVKEVANKYFDAMKKNDMTAFKTLLDDKSLKEFTPEAEKGMTESLKLFEKLDFTIKNVAVTGDTAKVDFTVTMTMQGKEESTDDFLSLAKVNDVWKLTAEETPKETTPQNK